MPPVESTMLAVGTAAPDFSLPGADGTTHTLASCMGESGLLVAFICNHCPYVKHVFEELTRLGNELPPQGLGMVGIMSNDIERYPDDGPEKMAETARANGWSFPYLLDEDQSIARAYKASCTPDFYLFDKSGKLVYRGQLDDSRPKSTIPVDGTHLRQAIGNLLMGEAPLKQQRPSLGCSIKWIPGQEPEWSPTPA